MQLAPLSVLSNWGLAAEYYLVRDYSHAIEVANKTLEIDPKYCEAVSVLGLAYEQMGELHAGDRAVGENRTVIGPGSTGHGTHANLREVRV